MLICNRKRLKPQRRELRKNQTDVERLLWSRLRNRQVGDVKFFRQFSVGPYILDFYAPLRRLAIELDGSQHGDLEHHAYDEQRTEYLKHHHIVVLRFWNNEVMSQLDDVLEKIHATVTESLNSSLPPLKIRGGTMPASSSVSKKFPSLP